MEKAYWNHEVARYLDIGESTLRKWCIELEKNGYVFIKGAKDSRAFTDHDLKALNHFKQLVKAKKHTMKQAAVVVIDKFPREGENERTPPDTMENNRSVENLERMIVQLLENQAEQKEFNKALLEKLEQQNNYIKESLEKRDQVLLENIRRTQEEKAASIEEEKKKIEELQKKKSKWQQLKEIFKA